MAWGMDFSQMDLFLNSTSTIYLLFDFGHTILSLSLSDSLFVSNLLPTVLWIKMVCA